MLKKCMEYVMAKWNLRYFLITCVVVIAIETVVIVLRTKPFMMFPGNPNSILQKGWEESLMLPSCRYANEDKKSSEVFLSCYLFVAVIVRPDGFEDRQLVRDTWYKYFTNDHPLTELRFFMGTYGLNDSLLQELRHEHKRHNDLVMLEGLLDSYHNLTRKTVLVMKWTSQHVNFTYYLKCDDDSYPLLDPILAELQERKLTTRLYWGHFFINLRVRGHGKNKDPLWFLTETYTPFAIGGAYILSRDLIKIIAGFEQCLHFYPNEDTSLGLWLSPFQLERKHDYRFCRNSQPCPHNTLIFLGRSRKEMLSLFHSSH